MPASFANRFMSLLIRSPFHFLAGQNLALITVTGSKSGASITTPVNVIREDEAWIIISLRTRTWWRNLRANPAARLHVQGRERSVRAELIEETAATRAALQQYFTRNPGLAKYFQLTLLADGTPDPARLETLAAERVVLRVIGLGE